MNRNSTKTQYNKNSFVCRYFTSFFFSFDIVDFSLLLENLW